MMKRLLASALVGFLGSVPAPALAQNSNPLTDFSRIQLLWGWAYVFDNNSTSTFNQLMPEYYNLAGSFYAGGLWAADLTAPAPFFECGITATQMSSNALTPSPGFTAQEVIARLVWLNTSAVQPRSFNIAFSVQRAGGAPCVDDLVAIAYADHITQTNFRLINFFNIICNDFSIYTSTSAITLNPGDFVNLSVLPANNSQGDLLNYTLNISPVTPCPADLDDASGFAIRNGVIWNEDLAAFFILFNIGDLHADFDDGTLTGTPDGAVDISDLIYYASIWFGFTAGGTTPYICP